VLALVIIVGAAAAFNGAGARLLASLFPAPTQAQSPIFAAATQTAARTQPPALTASATASATTPPAASATATSTVPATATPSLTPTATATPAPTATPQPEYSLTIARRSQDGFLLVNTGKIDFPLTTLELHTGDKKNRLLLSGEQWDVAAIKPGECVSMWVKGVRAQLPSGVTCTRVGKNLTVVSKDRFWDKPMALFYKEALLEICDPDQARCEYLFKP
jgi:hypothetical protein